MNNKLASLILALGLMLGAGGAAADFDDSVVGRFIEEMIERHQFEGQQLQGLFARAELRQDVLDAISRPAEAKPWYEYQPIFVTRSRIKGGVAFWRDNADTLRRAEREYGVPAEIIVAIIGVETRYGHHAGRYRVLDALSTLAFAYPPRSAFFRSELEHYLLMTREESMDPLELVGSYAGAMGQPQFISSSFRAYAVDFDGDGRRDLWNSTADAIGSVANYFRRHGWTPGGRIADPARVNDAVGAELAAAGIKPSLTDRELRAHGVRFQDGASPSDKAALIRLETRDGPEYWVGWNNFYVITRYNHSALYAMAVYQLSEAIKQAMSS